jgi:DNA-binding protein Fis
VSASNTIGDALRAWARAQWASGGQPENLYDRLLELVEPPVLGVALEAHQGQCAAAARSLGLHRVTLRKKLQQYGLGETAE